MTYKKEIAKIVQETELDGLLLPETKENPNEGQSESSDGFI